MAENFSIEQPRDTGDDRVSFIVKVNGTVLPGFISRTALLSLGGEGTLLQLFKRHHVKISDAVREKLPAPQQPYISLTTTDF